MRKIGELSQEREARAFGDALYVRGLENNVEAEDDGTFSIWVHDDDQLEQGRAFLAEFRAAPDSPEWRETASQASRQRQEEERTAARRASQVITRERMEYERNSAVIGWGPVLLAILSIAATVFAGEFMSLLPGSWGLQDGNSGRNSAEQVAEAKARLERFNLLSITAWRAPTKLSEVLAVGAEVKQGHALNSRRVQRLFFDHTLPEIRSGQVWRLFTPMFVHLGIIHLVFNLLWLRDLGSFAQHRFGTLYFWVLIFSIAAVSNLVQLSVSGPMFGGLSGINYGLLGFLWIRGKFDRLVVWKISPQIVQSMLAWFFLCFTPLIPGVANGAHAAGLLFGMLLGYITAQMSNLRLGRI